jgi:exodeoxyribonuclease VII large subunit
VDFTIADFVADVRAPTPSGAAELVVPDQRAWLHGLMMMQRRLLGGVQRHLTQSRQGFIWLQRRLAQLHPGVQLKQRSQRVDELEQRMLRALQVELQQRRHVIDMQRSRLQAVSPVMQLARAHTRLEQLQSAMTQQMRERLQRGQSQLQTALRTLQALSPLATLVRGYAIVSDAQGHAVTDAASLQQGDMIQARLARGNVTATVDIVKTDETSKGEFKS